MIRRDRESAHRAPEKVASGVALCTRKQKASDRLTVFCCSTILRSFLNATRPPLRQNNGLLKGIPLAGNNATREPREDPSLALQIALKNLATERPGQKSTNEIPSEVPPGHKFTHLNF
jgi:hypothetical protein